MVGRNKCAIVDTYWQTETGGHIMTPLPGATRTKPGSCTGPFFDVDYKLLDNDVCGWRIGSVANVSSPV